MFRERHFNSRGVGGSETLAGKGQTGRANWDKARMTKLGDGVVQFYIFIYTSFVEKEKLSTRPTPGTWNASLTIISFRRHWTETVLANWDAPKSDNANISHTERNRELQEQRPHTAHAQTIIGKQRG